VRPGDDADCWEGDWGIIETWAYKGLIMEWNEKPLLPYGGWLTYLNLIPEIVA
jgi:hypothetical protein